MSRLKVQLVKAAILVAAAVLLPLAQVFAGGMVPTAGRATSQYTPSPMRSAPAVSYQARPVAVSVVVTMPAKQAQDSVEVDLRGPDGQVRRFPVEGGLAAIQYRNVTLRPGTALTIHWTPAK
jgi:hypothetical protein